MGGGPENFPRILNGIALSSFLQSHAQCAYLNEYNNFTRTPKQELRLGFVEVKSVAFWVEWFDQILRELLDLLDPANFMFQQRQLRYVEILIQVFNLKEKT